MCLPEASRVPRTAHVQGSPADPGQLEIRPGLRAWLGPGTGVLRHGGFAPLGVRLSPTAPARSPAWGSAGGWLQPG